MRRRGFIAEGLLTLLMLAALLFAFIIGIKVHSSVKDKILPMLTEGQSIETVETMDFTILWMFMIILIGIFAFFILSAFKHDVVHNLEYQNNMRR